MLLPPFHADELAAQERAGVASSGAGIRASMPDQHRAFFAMLPFAFLGVSDGKGWPIATIIRGRVVMRDDEIVAEGTGAPVRFLETLSAD